MPDAGAQHMRVDTSIPGMAQPRASEARRVAVASAVGTTIEWYDFFIYGTAAAVVFAPQFFPQVSELAGQLAAFATFAIGFVARPLGGIVMGHFGDRVGRKSMLVWSLMLMGISTLAIGLLPNYARIGVWAPLLLTLLRFVQGFALGGEWGGAVLMSVEHAPQGRRGLFGSFVALGLPAGIVLSTLVFLIASVAVAPEQFAAWAWRLPFLASALLVVVGLFVRVGIAESPVFADVQRQRNERRMPVIDVMRGHARTVLLAAGSYVSAGAFGYVAIVYFTSYATRELGIPLTTTLGVQLLAAVVFAVSIVMSAVLSDRFGRRRIMKSGLAGLTLWSLVFFPLADTGSVPLIALALCGMLLLQGPYIGPQPAVFSELFPTAIRYSGVSLSLTLGTIFGGALAPAIATTLFGLTGSSWPITAYLATVALISWLCVRQLEETYRRNLSIEQTPDHVTSLSSSRNSFDTSVE
jgi:metabolite-proton symporter